VVVTKAVLFSSIGSDGTNPSSGSFTGCTLASAALVMDVPGGVPGLMCTVIVNVAVSPTATLELSQIMVVSLGSPAICVVQLKSGAETTPPDTKVVSGGTASRSVTGVEASGPLLVSVMV
jgi:hypothetical protein